VLICGESGTGKELVAKAIHRRSRRAAGPSVPLNMAALPRELVESTLFGHEKGAFTGATERRLGACEEAKGGTLFLDEISEMPLELQPKLLRFLQERVFRRIGGTGDIHSDTRIISATNRDALAEVQAGRLRADLFYRLNVVPIHLPPLRERSGDIPLLATWAVRQAATRHNKSFEAIDEEAMRKLLAYAWPGNVRELIHAIERVVVLNDGTTLTTSMLDGALAQAGSAESLRGAGAGGDGRSRAPSGEPRMDPEIIPLEELERRAIHAALAICHGSAAEAARRLGISNATIYRKLKEYGVDVRGYA
jgi:DNA-binding NtrC family response regulator